MSDRSHDSDDRYMSHCPSHETLVDTIQGMALEQKTHQQEMKDWSLGFEKSVQGTLTDMGKLIKLQDDDLRGGQGPGAAPGLKQRVATLEQNVFPWKKLGIIVLSSVLGGGSFVGAITILVRFLLEKN